MDRVARWVTMAAFARSLRPFLGATVSATRQSINPVQRVFGKEAIGVRGLATAFERTKPHVNIGTQAEAKRGGYN